MRNLIKFVAVISMVLDHLIMFLPFLFPMELQVLFRVLGRVAAPLFLITVTDYAKIETFDWNKYQKWLWFGLIMTVFNTIYFHHFYLNLLFSFVLIRYLLSLAWVRGKLLSLSWPFWSIVFSFYTVLCLYLTNAHGPVVVLNNILEYQWLGVFLALLGYKYVRQEPTPRANRNFSTVIVLFLLEVSLSTQMYLMNLNVSLSSDNWWLFRLAVVLMAVPVYYLIKFRQVNLSGLWKQISEWPVVDWSARHSLEIYFFHYIGFMVLGVVIKHVF